MRASGVRETIASVVKGLTPSYRATPRDVFRYHADSGNPPANASDRTFMLQLAGVGQPQYITPDSRRVTYVLTVIYHANKTVEDRIAEDAEQYSRALYLLHQEKAEIEAAQLGEVVVTEGRQDRTLEASMQITVGYRLTGV